MSKRYKWLAAILGGLVLIFLGLVLFVRLYLTGELIAAWIKPPMEHYLHRTVTLADARVGFRGFHVDGLEIRELGADTPLLKGEKLQLRWKFKELFKGRIAIHTLVFTKPEITLIRDEDGILNINDLLPEKTGSDKRKYAGEYGSKDYAGVPLLISLLSIENGRLNFVDRSQKPHATLEVRNLQSKLTDFSASAPIPFHLEGQIAGKGEGSLAVNGSYNPVENTLEGDFSLKGIDLARLSPIIAKNHSDAIKQGNLSMNASLAVEGFDHLSGHGILNLDGLQVKMEERLSQTLQVEANFHLDAVRSKETLEVNALHIDINGHKAEIQGSLTQWGQKPQFDFTLNSPQIKLDELIALLHKSPTVPEATEVPSDQQPVEDSSSTPEPKEKANANTASNSPSTNPEKESAEKPKTAKDGPESTSTTSQGAAIATGSGEGAESTTKNKGQNKPFVFNARGEVHADWFHYNKLVASNVDCKIAFQDGKLRVEPLSASLYGGTLGGNVKAETKAIGPPFNSRVYTENILLDEILAAFWPETTGRWGGNVNLFFRGKGSGSDLSVLESRTDLNINEAEFSGHPLFIKLAELFQAEDLQQLRFSQVTARVLTKEGVANIKRLHLLGPIVQAEGTGTAGLLDNRLDLHLLLQIRVQYVGKIAPLRDIVTKIADKHGFVELPLTVGGTFDEPVYGLDQRWLKKTAKKLGVKQVKKIQKKKPSKPPLSKQEQKQLKKDLEKLVQ